MLIWDSRNDRNFPVLFHRFAPRDKTLSEIYKQFLCLPAWFLLQLALSTLGLAETRAFFQITSGQMN